MRLGSLGCFLPQRGAEEEEEETHALGGGCVAWHCRPGLMMMILHMKLLMRRMMITSFVHSVTGAPPGPARGQCLDEPGNPLRMRVRRMMRMTMVLFMPNFRWAKTVHNQTNKAGALFQSGASVHAASGAAFARPGAAEAAGAACGPQLSPF